MQPDDWYIRERRMYNGFCLSEFPTQATVVEIDVGMTLILRDRTCRFSIKAPCKMSHSKSVGSDQSAHARSLTWELKCPLVYRIGVYIDMLADSVALRSDCVNAQPDLDLHCPRISDDKLLHCEFKVTG